MFKAEASELTALFEIDSIRDGGSANKLRILGGPEGLLKELHTSIKNGINEVKRELDARRDQYGDNSPYVKKQRTLFEMIIECFEDLMLQILCLASFVSTIIGILYQD